MAKYIIEESTLKGLANAIRKVNGEDRSYTPTEMIEAVTHIMESATYILVDENGNEVPAVYVENEAVFTATANDIRIGTVAATESGVTEGTKEIPAYYVSEGWRLISSGNPFVITATDYDFTKFQAVICPFNSSLSNSVYTEKVVINNSVYNVLSTEAIATLTVEEEMTRINLNIVNESDKDYIVRYFMYKEVY